MLNDLWKGLMNIERSDKYSVGSRIDWQLIGLYIAYVTQGRPVLQALPEHRSAGEYAGWVYLSHQKRK